MAGTDGRTPEEVRREIAAERESLAGAVEELRAGLDDVTDVTGKLRRKLPVVATGALGAGFIAAGGIEATMRLLARRGREGKRKALFGPKRIVARLRKDERTGQVVGEISR